MNATPQLVEEDKDTRTKNHIQQISEFEKGAKSIKQSQLEVLNSIEAINIEKSVKQDLAKFDPPFCKNCPKRRADRVCINANCGPFKYMQLICGKCHADKHAQSTSKPEIDIEEYFSKLSSFMAQTQFSASKITKSQIVPEKLQLSLSIISSFREKLHTLKLSLKSEVDRYKSPPERFASVHEQISKALSDCNYENIQEQLNLIKQSILFKQNQFCWGDYESVWKQYMNSIDELDIKALATRKAVMNGFLFEAKSINLNSVEVQKSSFSQQGGSITHFQYGFGQTGNQSSENIRRNPDSSIRLYSGNTVCQNYLKYVLEPHLKYRLRFKFDTMPMNYIIVGIMPLSQANSKFIRNMISDCLSIRFFTDESEAQINQVDKGAKLNILPSINSQIEMRICIQEEFLDFSDYPIHKHVARKLPKSNFNSDEEYVIVFALTQNKSVVIESFETVQEFVEF